VACWGTVSDEPSFRTDLFRGTAGYYDRFRLPYPRVLIDDLVRRAGASGQGRLLDLACGTGQLAFALRPWFAEVWAVDQEPDMVAMVRSKAAGAISTGETGETAGAAVISGAAEVAGEAGGRIVAVVSSAEELDVPAGHFSLITIGNAFHRLPRDHVARLCYGWLAPGEFLALCWSSGTQAGPLDWQVALGRWLRRWRDALGGGNRVPDNWNQAREQRPDADVLTAAGFELVGRFEFPVPHQWTLPELAGYARSLSVLPASALAGADQSAALEDSLTAELAPFLVDGHLTETVSFAYELARKPT
jgi:SAM-dependent methyltransferase